MDQVGTKMDQMWTKRDIVCTERDFRIANNAENEQKWYIFTRCIYIFIGFLVELW